MIGWRYWQLRPSTGRLHSVTHRRFEWAPHGVLRAVCLVAGHEAPAPGCACGIHAAASLDELRREGLCLAPGEALVTGEVALWGTVVADDHGLRGGLAAPARLWVVTPAGAEAQPGAVAGLAAYCVPVDAMPAHDALGDVAAAILANQSMSR